jgi:hypothetical protein
VFPSWRSASCDKGVGELSIFHYYYYFWCYIAASFKIFSWHFYFHTGVKIWRKLCLLYVFYLIYILFNQNAGYEIILERGSAVSERLRGAPKHQKDWRTLLKTILIWTFSSRSLKHEESRYYHNLIINILKLQQQRSKSNLIPLISDSDINCSRYFQRTPTRRYEAVWDRENRTMEDGTMTTINT